MERRTGSSPTPQTNPPWPAARAASHRPDGSGRSLAGTFGGAVGERDALRWVALAAAVATYALVVLGAVVRATGSGLGCPDWPLCHGGALPPVERTAVIEYSHRAWGAVTALLIMATAALWIRVSGARPLALLGATALAVLLAAQVLLGALTVALELSPPIVMVHLGMAMLLFGGLVWLAVEAAGGTGDRGQGTDDRGRAGLAADPRRLTLGPQLRLRPVLAAAAAVYLLMLTGALVRASGASWACAGFPACSGQALPFGADRLTDIHLLHRLLAYAVAGHIAFVVVRAWRTRSAAPGVRPAALAVGACLLIQIAVGAGMVSSGVPAFAQALHVAGAAALWGTVVMLVALAHRARSIEAPA